MRTTIAFLCWCFVAFPLWATKKEKSAKELELMQKLQSYNEKITKLAEFCEYKLHPLSNPFALIDNYSTMKRIFDGFLVSKDAEGRTSPTVLGRVHARYMDIERLHALDWRFADDALTEIEKELPNSKRKATYGHLLALQYLHSYLSRFDPNQEIVETKIEPDDKNQQKQSQQEKTKKPKEDSAELPDDYKAHTKDTEKNKGPGSKDDQFVHAEVNFATSYFGQKNYAIINRDKGFSVHNFDLPFTSVQNCKDTGKTLTVHVENTSEITLYIPPGYKPCKPEESEAILSRDQRGFFILKFTGKLKTAHLPLEANKEPLTPPTLDIYTSPVGIAESEWPESIQTAIFAKYPTASHSESANLNIARTIEKHIRDHYLYSVGARGETDPVDAVNSKAFQCDLAATVMVSILRDSYHIPSRVVGGFRAKKHKNGSDHKSYLVLPGEGHAWVEVYASGQWHHFDPTPARKDKKTKEETEGEKDEYSDRSDETSEEEEQDKERKDAESQASSDKSQKTSPESIAEQIAKDSKQRIDSETEKSKTNSESEAENKDVNLDGPLEIGTLGLTPQKDHNPFLDRAYRVFLKVALNPLHSSEQMVSFLYQTQGFFQNSGSDALIQIFQDAKRIHETKHPPLHEWLLEVQNLLNTRKLAITYKNIFRIHRAYEIYARLLDEYGDTPPPRALLENLRKLLQSIKTLAHKNAQDIAIGSAYYERLPGVIQNLMRKKYGFEEINDHSGVQNMVHDLKKNTLDDYKLIASLSKHTDFVLDASPRPEYRDIMTYERDSKRTTGNELMPLQRLSELNRGLMPKPGASIEENLRLGIQVPTRRKRTAIPSGMKMEEDERITILLYDISGSMSGTPAHFQAGLIATFAAQAIGDISPSGKQRHKILLVPFDDEVHEATSISTQAEAIALIENYQSKLALSLGGTDIQKALLEALKLIAAAEKKQGEPLAVANIILMTDGESTVDAQVLNQARSQIDRRTPIQTMFISIGSSGNSELLKFAQDSKKFGFDQSYYREFSNDVINKVIADSQKMPEAPPDSLYFERKPHSLPTEFRNMLKKAVEQAFQFTNVLRDHPQLADSKNQIKQLNLLSRSTTSTQKRKFPIRSWIRDLRRFGQTNILDKNRIYFDYITSDIYKNFQKLSGVAVDELDMTETSDLEHLLKYSAGLSNE